jgi:ABC-type transporter Mla subunit MlaD
MIGYAVTLNRRLGSLRQDKSELQKLAASFGGATMRAEEGIDRLKNMTDALQHRIDKARALHDDLTFLIDRGDTAADRLEETVRKIRQEQDQTNPPGNNLGGAENDKATETLGNNKELETAGKSEVELDLLKALQAAS